MRLQSDHGPVLVGVHVDAAPGLPRQDRSPIECFDPGHHHLVWSPNSAVEVRTPRRSFVAGAPDGLWLPGGHSYEVVPRSRWITARFEVASCPRAWNRVGQLPLGDVVGPMLTHLHHFPDGSTAAALVTAAVEHLHRSFASSPAPLHYPTDPRAREIADALSADPACPLELVEWAPRIGASERTLRRLFTEQTGIPFRRWRLRLRATTAICLLRDGFPNSEVAARCGYGSTDSLARAVRR
ncbi:MAG: AraC family transcriptional regulator, partial [Actinomycetota bacterium]